MRKKRLLPLLLLLFLSSCHPGRSSEGAVATLAGKPVTVSDLRETARFMGMEKTASRAFDEWSPSLAKTVFEETLYDRLLLETARKNGLDVSPGDLRAEADRIASISSPDAGVAQRPADDLVRRKLLLEKAVAFLAPLPKIPPKEIREAYNRDKEHYSFPQRAVVRDIVVRSEDEGKAILSALASGSSFSALAKAKSLSPESAKGGLLPPFAQGEMPAFFSAAFTMKPGNVSPLLSSPYGYHILKLLKLLPSGVRPFGTVRSRIEHHLQEKARKDFLAHWFSDKLESEHLEILPKYAPIFSTAPRATR